MKIQGVTLSLGSLENSYPHTHKGIEFLLIIKGSVVINIDDVDYNIKEDDIVLIHHQQIHYIKQVTNNVALLVKVSNEFLNANWTDYSSTSFLPCNSALENQEDSHYFELKRLIIRLMLCYWQKNEGYALEFQSLLFQLFFQTKQHFTIKCTNQTSKPLKEKENDLSVVLNYINDNFTETITLPEVSSLLYMTPQYFSKYFKEKTGISFLNYLMKLRLEHAVEELLSTDNSIIKISLNNGFANTKSFRKVFLDTYQTSPGEYRKKHQKTIVEPDDAINPFNIEDNDKQDLLRYIRQHQLINEQSEWIGKTNINVNVKPISTLKKPKNIINVGKLSNLFLNSTLNQLQETTRKLNITYVYFESLLEHENELVQHGPFFTHYDDYQLANILSTYKLTPFIKFDYSKLKQQENNDVDLFLQRLKSFCNYINNCPTLTNISDWHFEIACSNLDDFDEFILFYNQVYDIVINYSNNIGVLLVYNHTNKELDYLLKTLKQVKSNKAPSFISFYNTSSIEKIYTGISEGALLQLQNNQDKLVKDLKSLVFNELGYDINIFLPDWNTLTGKEFIQTGTFFRSALIIDAMIQLSSKVEGIGFHLNTYDYSMALQRMDTSFLSLYLYANAKRPVYFVLEAWLKLKNNVLYQDKNVIVSKDNHSTYTILIYHPCYVNPLYSVDDAYIEHTKKRLELVINNLPSYEYRIKRFTYDQDNGGIFKWWETAGSPDFKDEDVEQYMNSMVGGFHCTNQKITNKLIINAELSFNGIVLYELKPINN